MISGIVLPADLVVFLRDGRELTYDAGKCEAGQIRLVPLGEHTVGEVWVNPADKPDGQDPHGGEEGYYAIPAINLVAECEGYQPEFILLWLPDSKLYGTWDCDHWILSVFLGVTWAGITQDPLKYINAQWYPNSVESEEVVPWPKYRFKKGRPF